MEESPLWTVKYIFPLENDFYIASFAGGGERDFSGEIPQYTIELHRCVSCYHHVCANDELFQMSIYDSLYILWDRILRLCKISSSAITLRFWAKSPFSHNISSWSGRIVFARFMSQSRPLWMRLFISCRGFCVYVRVCVWIVLNIRQVPSRVWRQPFRLVLIPTPK